MLLLCALFFIFFTQQYTWVKSIVVQLFIRLTLSCNLVLLQLSLATNNNYYIVVFYKRLDLVFFLILCYNLLQRIFRKRY